MVVLSAQQHNAIEKLSQPHLLELADFDSLQDLISQGYLLDNPEENNFNMQIAAEVGCYCGVPQLRTIAFWLETGQGRASHALVACDSCGTVYDC